MSALREWINTLIRFTSQWDFHSTVLVEPNEESVIEIIQDHQAVLGDPQAGNQSTPATEILREKKKLFHILKKKDNCLGATPKDREDRAFEIVMTEYETELDHKYPGRNKDDAFLTLCSDEAVEGKRTKTKNTHKYSGGTAKYGVAEYPLAVQYFFQARDSPSPIDTIQRYRKEVDQVGHMYPPNIFNYFCYQLETSEKVLRDYLSWQNNDNVEQNVEKVTKTILQRNANILRLTRKSLKVLDGTEGGGCNPRKRSRRQEEDDDNDESHNGDSNSSGDSGASRCGGRSMGTETPAASWCSSTQTSTSSSSSGQKSCSTWNIEGWEPDVWSWDDTNDSFEGDEASSFHWSHTEEDDGNSDDDDNDDDDDDKDTDHCNLSMVTTVVHSGSFSVSCLSSSGSSDELDRCGHSINECPVNENESGVQSGELAFDITSNSKREMECRPTQHLKNGLTKKARNAVLSIQANNVKRRNMSFVRNSNKTQARVTPRIKCMKRLFCRKAAELGCVVAQYKLGCMYDNGKGVPQDFYKAIEWYHKAANHGDMNAQYRLGYMYDNGQGVPQDSTKAFAWYLKAADQGQKSARYRLGCMYHTGQGVPQDYIKAVEWYLKASGPGFLIGTL